MPWRRARSNSSSRVLPRRQRRPSWHKTITRPRTVESLERRDLLAVFNLVGGVADGAPGSLRHAILMSNSNGEDDVINLAAGTYALSIAGQQEDAAARGDLDLTELGRSVTIRGQGIDQSIVDARALDRAFQVNGGVTVSMEGLTIQGGRMGYANGAGVANFGDLTLTNMAVKGNELLKPDTQSRGGGGIYSQGNLRLEGVEVTGNTSHGLLGGGGIYSTGVLSIGPDTLVANNASDFDGAGIRVAFGSAAIEGAIVQDNFAGRSGGGIFVAINPNIQVDIVDSRVLDNVADREDGGGIFNGGQMTIASSGIFSNRANGNVVGANPRGAGIYNATGAALSVKTTSVNANAARTGGGIYNSASATLTLEASTLSSNAVAQSAGGLYNSPNGQATVRNSTFSGNTSIRGAGAILNDGTLAITSSTITGNRADAATAPGTGGSFVQGGGILSNGSTRLDNTIVAGNFSGTGSGAADRHDVKGQLNTQSSFNLIGFGTHGLTNNVNSNQTGVTEPGLGPLGDNGGPTQTHLLLPQSPAINAGSSAAAPLTDQRGFGRVGPADIGAYELQRVASSAWDYSVGSSQFGPGPAFVFGFGFDDLLPPDAENAVPEEPKFLGFEFDTGPLTFGGIADGPFGSKFGGEVAADFAGRIGFDLGFYINSGSVDVDYGGALNYIIDDPGDGGIINISTVLNVGHGSMFTISPKIGAYADLVLELDANVAATACVFGCVPVDVPLKVDETVELFALNRQDENGQFDGDIRFVEVPFVKELEKLFEIEAPDGRKFSLPAEAYDAAKRLERDANVEKQKSDLELKRAKEDLKKATTEQARADAQSRVLSAEHKASDAKARADGWKEFRKKVDDEVKRQNPSEDGKRKLGGNAVKVGLGVEFNEAEGSLLGVEAVVSAEFGLDKVATVGLEVGKFQVTLPDVNLDALQPLDSTGTLTATTADFESGSELDERRQLARLQIDAGAMTGPLIGVPLGKYSASLGPLSLEVQTVSYNIGPQLNVTQDVRAVPEGSVVFGFFKNGAPISVPVDVGDGKGFQLLTSATFAAGSNVKIDPDFDGDNVPDGPFDIKPRFTLDTVFSNAIGLDVQLQGAFEALGLMLQVAGVKIVDLGPLITHKHTLGTIDLGTVFDRTFKLGATTFAELDAFQVGATADGSSPGTALVGTPDPNDPNRARVDIPPSAGTTAPVYLAAPLVSADGPTFHRDVQYAVNGNTVSSLVVLRPGLSLEVLDGGGAVVTTIELVPAVPVDVAGQIGTGVSSLRLRGFQASDLTKDATAIVGLQFNSGGVTSVTTTRLNPQAIAIAVIPELGTSPDEGPDDAAFERAGAAAILKGLVIDVDADGISSPLTDGILVMRYLDGVRGDALVTGVVNPAGRRTSAAAVEAYIRDELLAHLDADDDGLLQAGTDGVLVARHVAGFTGPELVQGAVGLGARRTDADAIRRFLNGEKFTANQQPVLKRADGSVLPGDACLPGQVCQTVGGAGFQTGDIIDTTATDLFGVVAATTPADNAAAGSSAAAPARSSTAGASAFSAAQASRVTTTSLSSTFDFTLATYGGTVSYDELYLKDKNDPDQLTLVSTTADGSPLAFGGLGFKNLLDQNEIDDVAGRLEMRERTSVLGVDEPIFIEAPDAAGYTYEALGGLRFTSLEFDRDAGGNVYLDPTFDLYLFDGTGWVYEETIAADQPYQFAGGGVDQFRLFGLELPNQPLHRAVNEQAPGIRRLSDGTVVYDLPTTTGFTLAGPRGIAPTVRLTQVEPRQRLLTPDDVREPECTVDCGFAFGQNAEFTIVRQGASADVSFRFTDVADSTQHLDTIQLVSASGILIEGDEHLDVVIFDTSGGPIRLPITFQGGTGSDGAGNPHRDELRIDGRGALIDLVARDRITGVERIDIQGSGANTLKLDVSAVKNNTGTSSTLVVVAGADDRVEIGAGWTLAGTEGAFNVFTQDGATLKLSAAATPVMGQAAASALTLLSTTRGTETTPPPPVAMTDSAAAVSSSPLTVSLADDVALPWAASAAAAEASQPRQIVSGVPSSPMVTPGRELAVDLIYAAGSPLGSTGLNLRMFFDSTALALDQLAGILPTDFSAVEVNDDAPGRGFDDDPLTDKYVNLLWLDADGEWPDVAALPTRLLTANLQAAQSFRGTTSINFRGNTAAGFELDAPSLSIAADLTLRADADQYVVDAAGPSSAAAALGVLANDAIFDPAAVTAALSSGPSLGSAALAGDGSFTYTPGPGFWGVDSFTYGVTDGGSGTSSAAATVMSHDALQVRKLYNQVLGRGPELSGWEFWTRQVSAGVASLGTIASGIFESAERLNPIVAQMYRDFLFREADASGLAFWRGIWQRDGGPENVIAGIISSPEFFASAGGTNRLWVTELYRRLLSREPDGQGLGFWSGELDAGRRSRPDVVLGFIRSPENFRNLVRGWFVQYLDRQAAAGEESFFVGQLRAGVSRRSIQIQILDSPEYRNSPPPPPAGSARRV